MSGVQIPQNAPLIEQLAAGPMVIGRLHDGKEIRDVQVSDTPQQGIYMADARMRPQIVIARLRPTVEERIKIKISFVNVVQKYNKDQKAADHAVISLDSPTAGGKRLRSVTVWVRIPLQAPT